MYTLDKEFNLIFKDNSGNEITITEKIKDELKYEELTSFPKGTELKDDIKEVQFYKIIFPDGSILKIFKDPVKCKFKGYNKEIDLYSHDHLKLILEILKYNCPFYFSKFYQKKIYININKISEINIYVETHIEILEKIDDENKIKNLYKELKNKYDNKEINYTYEFLNPNYNKYYSNSVNLLDKFIYLNSDIRSRILYRVEYFVENNSQNNISTNINKDDLIIEENDPYLLPICGPHGIGKTITALYIHKYLFLKGIKGLYLNLKYYSKDSFSLEDKIEVLIKECFFIVENEYELLELYNKFIRLNSFFPAIFIIADFIEKKKNNNNIYMILDQYQDKYNFIDLLKLITKIKIFLISSINDKDVKTNLIKKYKEEIIIESKKPKDINPRDIIKYNYIDNLIDSTYFKSNIFKNIFLNKIKQYEKDEEKLDDELNYIYYILEKFNFIPKYVFRYINNYESVLDLLFHEYTNIIKKLNSFVDLGKINIDKLNELINNNSINKKKDFEKPKIFTKEIFVELLDYIPLQYISFMKKGNDEFYFYYTFPLFKIILEDFINYIQSKTNFFLRDEEEVRELCFKKIVKMELRGFKKLNIDGYFKVNKIINMGPTKKYKGINKNYFKFKDNIFIDPKISNRNDNDYDFAIYQPKRKNLILIKSKYIINSNTVTHAKSYYKSTAKKALDSFNLITHKEVKNVYLLYISSVDYNYENRKNVMENILSNSNINCIFNSVNYGNFSMDFGNFIKEIQCKDSFMIIPESNLYEEQIPLDNSNFITKIQIKGDKKKKDKILLQRKNLKVVNLKELHTQIIDFIKKSNFDQKDIIKSLGPYKVMNNYFISKQFEMNKRKEYTLLFYLDKFGNFDSNKDLGLIYFENGKNYFYDFYGNKEYDDQDELVNEFSENFFYVIGTKIKKNK